MTVVDDNYTGHVEPGTAARRTLPGASIVKVSVGPMDNNAYLVTCSQTGETLLIDAANDAEILLELIERYAPKLSLIVTSHQHQDHWLALDRSGQGDGAPTAAHQLDAEPLPVKPDRILAHGDTVTVGELTFDVIHLQRPHPGIGGVGARAGPTRKPAPPTCSPATACFPAAWADVAGPATSSRSARRRHEPGVRRVRRLDGHLSRSRRRHHAGRRASASRRVARTRLVILTAGTPVLSRRDKTGTGQVNRAAYRRGLPTAFLSAICRGGISL